MCRRAIYHFYQFFLLTSTFHIMCHHLFIFLFITRLWMKLMTWITFNFYIASHIAPQFKWSTFFPHLSRESIWDVPRKNWRAFFLRCSWLLVLIRKIFFFASATALSFNHWTMWQMSVHLALLHDSLPLLCVTCTHCMRLCLKIIFFSTLFSIDAKAGAAGIVRL